MKKLTAVILTAFLMAGLTLSVSAHDLVTPKNKNESYGYKDSPQQWWSKYRVHDSSRPIPKRVTPGTLNFATAPSDAIVLFNGKDLNAFKKTEWKLVDGTVECTTGALESKQTFKKFQLHLEWCGPKNFKGDWGNQGNNGVLLQGIYEIQVFDSYNINNYPDGVCGAIYGQVPPLVNATLPPGQWQTYDIFFTPAIWEGDKLASNPRVTIIQNGVMVQNNQEIFGTTTHFNLPSAHPKNPVGPIKLSGHHCPVQFRNIWVRSFE